MSDQSNDSDSKDLKKLLLDRGIPEEAIDKLFKEYPEKKPVELKEPFCEINKQLHLFLKRPKAVGFIQQEKEGRWVCAINFPHRGDNRVGAYFSLKEAKEQMLKYYNTYF